MNSTFLILVFIARLYSLMTAFNFIFYKIQWRKCYTKSTSEEKKCYNNWLAPYWSQCFFAFLDILTLNSTLLFSSWRVYKSNLFILSCYKEEENCGRETMCYWTFFWYTSKLVLFWLIAKPSLRPMLLIHRGQCC